jgi:hypothetical protein
MSHKKSVGSCGGPNLEAPSSLALGETIVVRRGGRPSDKDSAPPK